MDTTLCLVHFQGTSQQCTSTTAVPVRSTVSHRVQQWSTAGPGPCILGITYSDDWVYAQVLALASYWEYWQHTSGCCDKHQSTPRQGGESAEAAERIKLSDTYSTWFFWNGKKLNLNTLPRSDFVSYANFTNSSRCNSRAGCCYHIFYQYLTPCMHTWYMHTSIYQVYTQNAYRYQVPV